MHIALHDAFGTTVAEGDLDIYDSPGSTPDVPSTREQLRTHLNGQRVTLNLPDIPSHMAWSITVTDV